MPRYKKKSNGKKVLTVLLIIAGLIALFLVSFGITSMILDANKVPNVHEGGVVDDASPTPKPTYEELEEIVKEQQKKIEELESQLEKGKAPATKAPAPATKAPASAEKAPALAPATKAPAPATKAPEPTKAPEEAPKEPETTTEQAGTENNNADTPVDVPAAAPEAVVDEH